jgi:predicted nucleic acid-binding protein
MRVLVDTSVWAEYFRRKSRLPLMALEALSELIAADLLVIIQPIRAEVLSGHIKKGREQEVRRALESIEPADLDWSAAETWNQVVACAHASRERDLPVLGIVDRMILLAGEASNAKLWTLDKPLEKVYLARGNSIQKV